MIRDRKIYYDDKNSYIQVAPIWRDKIEIYCKKNKLSMSVFVKSKLEECGYVMDDFYESVDKLFKELESKDGKEYAWKDVVRVNGKDTAEVFPISGEMDDVDIYKIDDFLEAVAAKYGVDKDDIKTYMMDDIEFDPETVEFGAEDCGCYIDGVAEWHIDL